MTDPMREKCSDEEWKDIVDAMPPMWKNRIKELEAKLKDEAHDAHMWKHRAKEFERAKKVGAEYLSAKLAKAVEALKKISEMDYQQGSTIQFNLKCCKDFIEELKEICVKAIEEIEGEK